MDPHPEYSIFLIRILEELDTKHSTVSYQDLCKLLCSRFDLVHLAKLRSLLFYTACLDPSFPAGLFKDKLRCSKEDPQSNKLMVAADVVTMFNLIQMNGGTAKHELPAVKKQANSKCQDCDRGAAFERRDHPRDASYHHLPQENHSSPGSKACEWNSCKFIPTSKPQVLLGVSKDLKFRAASLDKLHNLPRGSSPCEMQTTYFPMDVDSESTSDQESLQHGGRSEPLSVHSCSQKRNIFKEDFHNVVAVAPQVVYAGCNRGSKAADSRHVKPPTFFNHSFELPYTNPYSEATLSSAFQERWKVKHESLDDLQASTYFGPSTVSECVSKRKFSNRAGNPLSWPVKSLSLNTEEAPSYSERPYVHSKPVAGSPHCTSVSPSKKQLFQDVAPSADFKKKNGTQSKDAPSMASGPARADKRQVMKKFREKNPSNSSFQGGDCFTSVGTQTEQKKEGVMKEFPAKCANQERNALQHSEEDSEVVSDDISDIFRFLDDMSVCDSLGVVPSSCYNSIGSLSQVTLKSEGDSSPERSTVRLARSKLDRLFHSLENTDDELKSSVCKLVKRIGEIERKLEGLSGVRGEISEVLSKLDKLDGKIQEPDANGRLSDAVSGSFGPQEKPHPHSHKLPLSPRGFQCHTIGHNVKVDNGHMEEWCYSDGSNGDSLRVKALKNSMFPRRSSHSLNEENSATESKVASITNSPRDWRTLSYSCHPGDEERERDVKDRQRKAKEVERERQYELPQAHRPLRQAEDSYINNQIFLPHPLPASVKDHASCSPLYTNLRFTSLSDGKRGELCWTTEKSKRKSGEKGKMLAPLDMQIQESPNPNNLEYWMEDVYTPGYDSLLKKKEAEFRRTKAWKIGALIAAATCTVILVIVVPICTMKS